MKTAMAVAMRFACLLAAGCTAQDPPVEWSVAPASGAKVRVVYAHRTLRCVSCLLIEKLARETVQENFADRLTDGTLTWQTVDFWQDKPFAEQYGVDSPTVVVINCANGRQVSYQRLDQLWGLKMDGDRFRAVVIEAVQKALREAQR
ncbi:MAG: hypothetical protein BIFFINMI_02706 [Phycisphaerae bacterium]|nr:hypothetical protein [Phycisphaerae bacterium]